MDRRFLGQYVDEMKASSPARFASSHTSPMLVVRDVGVRAEEDDPAFQTKFMSRSEMFAATSSGSTPLDGDAAVIAGQVIPVVKRAGGAFADRIGIGRAPNVDVRIPLSQISKYHAYLSKSASGGWTITDAGSRNGTSVNQSRIAERLPHPIEDGGDLMLGPYRFTFHTPEGFLEVVKRRAGVR